MPFGNSKLIADELVSSGKRVYVSKRFIQIPFAAVVKEFDSL